MYSRGNIIGDNTEFGYLFLATYADVRLPEEYTTTTNNQQFLQYDNGQNAENRMLVF
jgi:hypothetical protein